MNRFRAAEDVLRVLLVPAVGVLSAHADAATIRMPPTDFAQNGGKVARMQLANRLADQIKRVLP